MRQLLSSTLTTFVRDNTRQLSGMSRLPRDVKEFLDGYPGVTNDPNISANLAFYSNTGRCRPDNILISQMHSDWWGDYEKLEYKHGFIQWLFPIKEHGMNYESQPLQDHELESMLADPLCIERVVKSYELMLDFYGMRLLSQEDGKVDRVLPPRNCHARYRNLVRSSHNNLRISRILKCLSEMGLERFNAGFLLHVLHEQSENDELNSRGICSSMDSWWAHCVRNEEERIWIGEQIHKVRVGEKFTRADYESALERRTKTGSLGGSE